MSQTNSSSNGGRPSSGFHTRPPTQMSNVKSTSSNAKPLYIRPATAMGGSYSSPYSSTQPAVPPMPTRPSATRSQSSQLSPHAPTYVPQAPSQGHGSIPASPTTPSTPSQSQNPPQPVGPPQISCCAIGYEISNLSILTYLQSKNQDPSGTPAALYERFLKGVTRILSMPLMIVLPQHTNPLLCIMVFYDQPTDLFDIMHFPVPNNFLRIRQTHQIPVQGHLRKMYIPKARILTPDVLEGTEALLWR
ncbi:hypothetical protein CALVIDRAFT_536368 [Calocera viscosa TUFC12733]|uniref:Uncharacterized protein n=1 Tax=Calocera viscosa (strain TUFC12733) TaxID=1330018 RepID=A0A167N584_CALVF|nr:hypothetical protein CALVIDRAFT_536368 [Calocera viscosa TUFC12733]